LKTGNNCDGVLFGIRIYRGSKRYNQYRLVIANNIIPVIEIFICFMDPLDRNNRIPLRTYPIITSLVVGYVRILEPNKKLPIVKCLYIQIISNRLHANMGIRNDP